MQPIITENQEKIEELCRTHHVRKMSAFGSAVRDDFEAGRSDVDLLVEFQPLGEMEYAPNYFSLMNELDELFEIQVDLVTASALKNPFLKRSVEEDKVELYAA